MAVSLNICHGHWRVHRYISAMRSNGANYMAAILFSYLGTRTRAATLNIATLYPDLSCRTAVPFIRQRGLKIFPHCIVIKAVSRMLSSEQFFAFLLRRHLIRSPDGSGASRYFSFMGKFSDVVKLSSVVRFTRLPSPQPSVLRVLHGAVGVFFSDNVSSCT